MTLGTVWLRGYDTKTKIYEKTTDKLEGIKIKNFCSAKDNVKGIKWQAADWEKISAKDTSDKGVLSKI